MDVTDKLDELTAAVESARSMPMSGSCIVNRAEVLTLVDDLRRALPDEFGNAQQVLADRDAVVEEGRSRAQSMVDEARAYAERLVARAQAERSRLIEESDVLDEAARDAADLRADAEAQAGQMRAEADAYVDRKLAEFAVVLDKTLAVVHRGREKLRGEDDSRADGQEASDDGSGTVAPDIAAGAIATDRPA